jgi:hypothetical protein
VSAFDQRRRTSSAGPGGDGSGCAPGRSPRTAAIRRKVARAASGTALPSAADAVDRAAGDSGRPLPDDIRDRFGASLGADLSSVRVHTGADSAAAARAIGARAYASGPDIHFADGQYAPGDPTGLHLLAHEVAHTVQQGATAGEPQCALEVSEPGDAAEQEADRVADALVAGRLAPMPTIAASLPQRKLQRWADSSSAQAVIRVIDAATPEQLGHIEAALGDAEGSADAMVPVELPGWAGYVAHDDLRPLRERAHARASSSTAPADPGAVPGLSGGVQGLISGRDAALRMDEYIRPAQQLSQQVMNDVASGRIDHLEGREVAAQGRNQLRLQTRERLSPGGRGTSEAIEPRGPSVGELADRYSMRMLEQSPELRARFGITTLARGDAATERALTTIRESPEVSRAIIAAAGRSNAVMTGFSRVMRVAGPAMTAAQVAVGGYRVLTADEGEHMWTAGREISGFAGGSMGSVAGGLVVEALGAVAVTAGVAVSAPVAIVVSLVVIGGMAIAGDSLGRNIWDHNVDHSEMRSWELEMGEAIQTFARASMGDRIGALMPIHALAAGGGYAGLMERDRQRMLDLTRPPPTSSGGEAP